MRRTFAAAAAAATTTTTGAAPRVAINNPLRNVTGAAGAVAGTLGDYVSSHRDGVVALGLAVAMAVVFSGRTLLQPAVFLVGFLPTFAYFESIGYELLPDAAARVSDQGAAHVLPILVTCTAVLLGVVAGVVMLRLLFTPAVFLITAAAGVVAVVVVHHLLFQSSYEAGAGEVILVTLGVIAALLFGMTSLIYPQSMVIFGTAFDGAAAAVYFLAYFLGNQEDILSLDATVESPWWVFGYTVATVLLGTYGAVIQLRVASADRKPPRQPLSRRRPQGEASASSAPVQANETEPLLPTYGSIEGDFEKTNGLGAPPLLGYEDEESGRNR